MINQLYSLQFLGSVCKMPVGEDGSFAKKSMVAKKNRYKDKFPCTVYRCKCSCKLLYQCARINHNMKVKFIITSFSMNHHHAWTLQHNINSNLSGSKLYRNTFCHEVQRNHELLQLQSKASSQIPITVWLSFGSIPFH